MQKHCRLFLSFLLLTASLAYGEVSQTDSIINPKIGLVLSGGGAKGMAHVGVLKILDELKIKPDYITGSSMGGIVGGLYAIGYSATEIEQILTKQDWTKVLSNDVKMSDININDKEKHGQFFVKFPIQGHNIKLPKGLIFGQRIINLLQHYTLPAYDIRNFDSLPIPFKCIGADITTGETILLDTGTLAKAMRASMAIPTIFTPVLWGDRMIVDGGLSRNFPVKEVIDMGADIVIGSYTGGILKSKDNLHTILDLMGQAAFFKGVIDAEDQKKLVDIYIEPNLFKYKASDFAKANSIISAGEDAARKAFTNLKKLANKIDTDTILHKHKKLRMPDTIVVSDIVTKGHNSNPRWLLLANLGLKPNTPFSISQLESGIKRVYGSQYFYQLYYTFLEDKNKQKKLILHSVSRPKGHIGGALHYDSEKRAAFLANLTIRDILLPASKMSITANISENPGFQFDYYTYAGKKRFITTGIQFNSDASDLPMYYKGDLNGLYKYNYISGEAYLRFIINKDSRFSLGVAIERTVLKPIVHTINSFSKWQLNNKKVYISFERSTTNKRYFTTSGIDLSVVYEHNFDMKHYADLPASLPDYNNERVFNKKMSNLILHFNHYHPILKSLSIHSSNHLGLTFGDNYTLSKQFSAGGIFTAYSYLIPFTGFKELEYNADQIITGGIGLQYEIFKKIYIEPQFNALFSTHNFSLLNDYSNFVMGYGIQLGYASIIGPVILNISSNTFNKRIRSFFNIGYRFRF